MVIVFEIIFDKMYYIIPTINIQHKYNSLISGRTLFFTTKANFLCRVIVSFSGSHQVDTFDFITCVRILCNVHVPLIHYMRSEVSTSKGRQ